MRMRILIAPNKSLSVKADDVAEDEFGEELSRIMSNMAETMYYTRGVGLAAQQVGLSKRILVADVGEGGGSRLVKMVNPVIKEVGSEISAIKEGCLSLPSFSALIKRPSEVLV